MTKNVVNTLVNKDKEILEKIQMIYCNILEDITEDNKLIIPDNILLLNMINTQIIKVIETKNKLEIYNNPSSDNCLSFSEFLKKIRPQDYKTPQNDTE